MQKLAFSDAHACANKMMRQCRARRRMKMKEERYKSKLLHAEGTGHALGYRREEASRAAKQRIALHRVV